MVQDPPSRQIDELKSGLFIYVILAPLISALFAERIDSVFIACALFVGVVGTFFSWLRTRLDILEKSVREQEERLTELTENRETRPENIREH
jgi:hypothetical protein